MLRRVLAWLTARLEGEETDDESDGKARFVPSRLDDSVRVAHGGNSATVEREVEKVRETARMLEEHQRER